MTAPQKALFNAVHASLRKLSRTDCMIQYLDTRACRLVFELLDVLDEVMRHE